LEFFGLELAVLAETLSYDDSRQQEWGAPQEINEIVERGNNL